MMQEQTLAGAPRESAAYHEGADVPHGRAGQTAADAFKIEAAPSLALNDIIDVPMMLRVVEREAQTLSHNQHTPEF